MEPSGAQLYTYCNVTQLYKMQHKRTIKERGGGEGAFIKIHINGQEKPWSHKTFLIQGQKTITFQTH